MGGLFGRIIGVSVVVGLFLASTATAAPSEDPETLIHQGIELRKKGDDLRAEGYFRRAYDLARTPRSAAQLGLVEMALGVFTDADEYLSQALASPDAWVRANSQVLRDALDRARTHLLRIQMSGLPLGATINTPTRSAIALSSDRAFWLAPGQTLIHVEAPGYSPVDIRISGIAGETRQVPVGMTSAQPQATKAAPALPPPPPDTDANIAKTPEVTATGGASSRGLRWGGIGTGAVGIAAAIVGGVVFGQGSTKRDNLQSPTLPYNRSDDNWKGFETAGIGLLAGGGVLIAGGVAMYLIGRRVESSSSDAPVTSVSAVAGPGFGVLRLDGHF
ncbi:MAG TPA: hypothetical protein VH374_09800 [Polyangia bacterium]|jgi:hypothetical protein|nr:hypothetical protein [Polyangia bacterium]